jgi:hypothetical protein
MEDKSNTCVKWQWHILDIYNRLISVKVKDKSCRRLLCLRYHHQHEIYSVGTTVWSYYNSPKLPKCCTSFRNGKSLVYVSSIPCIPVRHAIGLHVVVFKCAHNVNKHGQCIVRTIWVKKGYLIQYSTTVTIGTRPNSELNYPHLTPYTLTTSMTTLHTRWPQTPKTRNLFSTAVCQLKYPYFLFPLHTALFNHLILTELTTFK